MAIENPRKRIQQLFRTETQLGRWVFIGTVYLLYWLLFYGVWTMDRIGLSVFRMIFTNLRSVYRLASELPEFYKGLVENVGVSDVESLVIFYFFILAPIVSFLLPITIKRTIQARGMNYLYLCSLCASLFSIVYVYLYISLALSMAFPQL